MRMKDKAVVVTGAARNTSLGIASRFAREGAAVAILDILAEQAEESAENLRRAGARAIAITCDVPNKADVDKAAKEVLAKFGKADVLVNNAGLGGLGSEGELSDINEEDFDKVMRVSVKSVFLCSQAFSASMIERKQGGSIINILSINAIMVSPGQLAYATSKALALALAPHQIRVNAIAPGSIRNSNSGHQRTFAGHRKMVLSRIPLGRLGTPEDVGGVAILCKR